MTSNRRIKENQAGFFHVSESDKTAKISIVSIYPCCLLFFADQNYYSESKSKTATKDQAISSLREIKKLQDTKLIVFGDSMNDVGMFKLADIAVAVSNASLEIKNLADTIIMNNPPYR